MSKIDINFNDYKASGVYFIEKDNSIIESIISTSGRLAVGLSKKGPFNTLVYLDNTGDLAEVFGGPDKALERKGVFFNRSLQTLLGTEPVYALNLIPFDEEDAKGERSGRVPINEVGVMLMGTKPSQASQEKANYYQDLHNTSRFWTPNSKYLSDLHADDYDEAPSIVNFANIGTNDFTLIVRKSENTVGYNMSVRDWYGTDDAIPYKWMDPSDKMSDYLVQVICISGDWRDPKLAYDSFWSEYFTTINGESGLKRDKVNKFIKLDQVEVLGNYTGCILPDFYDKSGALKSIVDIVNSYTTKTGLLMSVNDEAMEEASAIDLDFVGHTLPLEFSTKDRANCDFMSYSFDYVKDELEKVIDASVDVQVKGNVISFSNDCSVLKDLTPDTMIGLSTPSTKKAKSSSETNIPTTRIVKRRIYGADSSIYCEITVSDGTKLAGLDAIKKLLVIPSIVDKYSTLKTIKLKGLDIDTKINNLFSKDITVWTDNDGYSYMGEDVPIARIYNMLNDKGIRRALLNRQIVDYRYVIDTMAHGLGEECGSKKMLSKLAKDHERTTAFINAPSIAEFQKCTLAAFYDANDPRKVLDTKYIPMGGNDELIKNVEFTQISEDNGSKFGGVFSPFLVYRDGAKEILVPPAADVANAYMAKYNGGDPYVTVANGNGILNNGKIRGLEYEFDDIDRGYLEPFGINPIINEDGKVMIYGDRTAFQNYITDYNYLHVREILNTIEIECNAILKKYVFKYNNPQIRSEISKKINPILTAMKDAGALYRYELEMDEDNNQDEVIDRAFAILDLGVWVTKNMEKVIARITVNKLSQD